jgi:hypothetical protein
MAAKRKPTMAAQNWQPIRWGTKHEEDDIQRMLMGRVAEDLSRVLDRCGWHRVRCKPPASHAKSEPPGALTSSCFPLKDRAL